MEDFIEVFNRVFLEKDIWEGVLVFLLVILCVKSVNVIIIYIRWYGYFFKDMFIFVDVVLVFFFFNFWLLNVFKIVFLILKIKESGIYVVFVLYNDKFFER